MTDNERFVHDAISRTKEWRSMYLACDSAVLEAALAGIAKAVARVLPMPLDTDELDAFAHELFPQAQCLPNEGIEDVVKRIREAIAARFLEPVNNRLAKALASADWQMKQAAVCVSRQVGTMRRWKGDRGEMFLVWQGDLGASCGMESGSKMFEGGQP